MPVNKVRQQVHLPQWLDEHAHLVLQTRRSWCKAFPALQVCQCVVSWGDYSHTWYRCVCACPWVRSFTQLWIIYQDWCEGQEQLFRHRESTSQKVLMVSKKVKSWFSQLLDFAHSQGATQPALFGEKERLKNASNVEKSWIHDDIYRKGNNWEIEEILLLSKIEVFVSAMYRCTSCNGVNKLR